MTKHQFDSYHHSINMQTSLSGQHEFYMVFLCLHFYLFTILHEMLAEAV